MWRNLTSLRKKKRKFKVALKMNLCPFGFTVQSAHPSWDIFTFLCFNWHTLLRRIHIYYANMNRESRKGTNVKYYDKTEVNWSHYSSELLNVARYNYVTDMFDPALIAESDFKSLRDIFPNIFPGNFSSPVVFRRPQDWYSVVLGFSKL